MVNGLVDDDGGGGILPRAVSPLAGFVLNGIHRRKDEKRSAKTVLASFLCIKISSFY